MNKVMAQAKSRGKLALNTAQLPDFAIEVAEATLAGDIEAADAEAIYVAYYDAVIKRTPSQSAASHKVQVSKLRQIIKLAEQYDFAAELLRKVARLQAAEPGARPAYICMVDVARAQLGARKQLSTAAVLRIIRA